MDLSCLDIKETDARRHLALTGVELAPILDNLRALHDRGANILVRCPIIPGVNQREDHLLALSAFAILCPVCTASSCSPYHSLGVFQGCAPGAGGSSSSPSRPGRRCGAGEQGVFLI